MEFKGADSGTIMILRTKAFGAAVAQWFEDNQEDWVGMFEGNTPLCKHCGSGDPG